MPTKAALPFRACGTRSTTSETSNIMMSQNKIKINKFQRRFTGSCREIDPLQIFFRSLPSMKGSLLPPLPEPCLFQPVVSPAEIAAVPECRVRDLFSHLPGLLRHIGKHHYAGPLVRIGQQHSPLAGRLWLFAPRRYARTVRRRRTDIVHTKELAVKPISSDTTWRPPREICDPFIRRTPETKKFLQRTKNYLDKRCITEYNIHRY